MRTQVEEMKKKNKKKAGGAKKDKDEPKPEASTADEVEPSQSPPPADEAADETPAESAEAKDEAADRPTSPRTTSSQQSKLRSASFRAGSASGATPLSPTSEGETAADIYRKQVARIEDLEKENKRLAKEAGDSEKRWQKAEEELADLKTSETKTGTRDDQVEKLVCNSSVSEENGGD